MSARTVRDFNYKFGVPICQHYGSSETGAVANHIPDEILRRPDSVGKAMKNVPIRVVAADGTPVLPGAEGEVVVAGDGVALGYLMGKPEHRDSLRAGSYWTGDVGYLDADGFLYIRGRVDQVINVGGHKVSPDEVALALEDHPAVREAGVVGIKDSDGGEIIVGVVALNGPADEGAILKFCRDRLAAYKVPRRIIIMPELPKGPSGKVRVLPEDIAL